MNMIPKVVLITITMCLSYLTSANGKLIQTQMIFYIHNTLSGEKVTAVEVVVPPSNSSMLPFGTIVAGDDLITVGPNPESEPLARAQGLYSITSLDKMNSHLIFSVVFQHGKFKGSTLQVQGVEMYLLKTREVSIVSGTGKFRFARGYALVETHSANGLNSIEKWTVIVQYPLIDY